VEEEEVLWVLRWAFLLLVVVLMVGLSRRRRVARRLLLLLRFTMASVENKGSNAIRYQSSCESDSCRRSHLETRVVSGLCIASR